MICSIQIGHFLIRIFSLIFLWWEVSTGLSDLTTSARARYILELPTDIFGGSQPRLMTKLLLNAAMNAAIFWATKNPPDLRAGYGVDFIV